LLTQIGAKRYNLTVSVWALDISIPQGVLFFTARIYQAEKEKIVNFQKFFNVKAAIFCLALAVTSMGQVGSSFNQPRPVAAGNNLYCAGYIQYNPMATENKIIGSNDEADKYNYALNDFMYINMGTNKGVSVGDIFSVVRPRAHFNSGWSHKGALGFYVQEVGAVQVVRVGPAVAVAKVISSCDTFLLGDLVQLTERRVSPMFERRGPLDMFTAPSGKATGRVLMSRDGAELLTRDFIVYVDLGAEDHVQAGDHLTIFRELGLGNLFTLPQHEDVSARDYGFESEVYHGGKFSNMAPRKTGGTAGGKEVTTYMAKQHRPSELRKVVGEAVVLNVKERTATVVITRTAAEVHPGDWVEIQ